MNFTIEFNMDIFSIKKVIFFFLLKKYDDKLCNRKSAAVSHQRSGKCKKLYSIDKRENKEEKYYNKLNRENYIISVITWKDLHRMFIILLNERNKQLYGSFKWFG